MIRGLNKVSASAKKRTLTAIGNIFLFTDVGNEIGMAQGWSAAQIDTFHMDMLAAIQSGSLKVRSRLTGLPTVPSESVYQWVHPDDVNEWLERQGLAYRWVSPNEPVPSDIVTPETGTPAWSLKPTPERLPGYRWPLYQFLKEAHTAGKKCPKAQHVLDAWKLSTPMELKVIQVSRSNELEYEIQTGTKKRATVKQIQAVIKDLLAE
ncbi:MAG: hypothetical protein D4R79_02345 [Comamonadaceae bacterium]|nr:MAG: hypothetical protein D4R79_02345 [Comamonadaceae bacterium]